MNTLLRQWLAAALLWCFLSLFPSVVPGQREAETAIRGHLALAEQLLDQGQFVAALQEAQTARALLPSTLTVPDTLASKVCFWLGRSRKALGHDKPTQACLDSALLLTGKVKSSLYFNIALHGNEEINIRDALDFFSLAEWKNDLKIAEAHLNLATLSMRQGLFLIALAELEQGVDKLQRTGQGTSLITARCYQQTGYCFWKYDKQYDKAIDYFKKAEAIYLQNGGPESNYLAALYGNMCGCYNDWGSPRIALGLCEKALENCIAQDAALSRLTGREESHPILINLYNNLGNALSALGEYASAIRYLEKVVQLRPEIGRYWNNLGDAYLKMEDLAQAESCFTKALLLLLKSEKGDSVEIARPYHNLGLVYRQKGQLDKALEYGFKSLPYRKSDGFFNLNVARSYLGIGECLLAKKDLPAAIRYLDTALWIQHRQLPSGQYGEIAAGYTAKALCLAGLNDLTGALQLADSALYACGWRGERFDSVHTPLEFLSALENKAALLFRKYQRDAALQHLEAADKTYDLAAKALQHFRTTLLDNESRSAIIGQFHTIFTGGVEAAFKMYSISPTDEFPLRRSFTLAEQSKALLLLEGVRISGAIQFEGVPDSLLAAERTHKRVIAEAKSRLEYFFSVGKDSLAAIAQNELFRVQRNYETFQRKLQTGGFVHYYRFKYGFPVSSPGTVQRELLRPGQTLLEYFVTDSSIFLFAVRPDRFKVVRVKKDFPLDTLVRQFQHGVYGYHTAPKSLQTDALKRAALDDCIRAGTLLYAKLISPVLDELDSSLIIVPDPLLGQIPFEALLSAPPRDRWRYHEYPFFGKTRTISYCYSANLLKAMREKRHERAPDIAFLGFAPFFSGDTSGFAAVRTQGKMKDAHLEPLQHSGREVWRISKLLRGKPLYGAAATAARLREEGPRARILHFSTHGLTDTAQGDKARLWFANPAGGYDALQSKDIYALALNADLVVFSACQTGAGQLRVGEGVISLSRAFAYAGAKSLINTLWSVEEESAGELLWLFYDRLAAGTPPDRALAQAKRTFISRFRDRSEAWAHPFFWAGFVGVGI